MLQTLILTQHAQKRCAQRGIDPDNLIYAIRNGKRIRKQGYLFYFLRSKDIPPTVPPHKRGRIKNLVVITRTSMPDLVVTVYRNPEALKLIKKKSSTLLWPIIRESSEGSQRQHADRYRHAVCLYIKAGYLIKSEGSSVKHTKFRELVTGIISQVRKNQLLTVNWPVFYICQYVFCYISISSWKKGRLEAGLEKPKKKITGWQIWFQEIWKKILHISN